MNRTLPNTCSLLSTGKASSLAYTVYAADGTVSQARVYGSMTEIGTSATYTGPAIIVADTLSGYVLYDYDGDAETMGTVIPPDTFAALPLANLDAPISGLPSANANAIALVDLNTAGHIGASTFGAAMVTAMNDAAAVKATTDNLTNAPTVVAIRQEMDANSTKLAFLDAAVSSRSTFAGGAVASVTAPVTLTPAYDPAKTAAQVGSAMTLDLTQKLSAPRALDSVSDTSLTLNDALHCAIADAAGKAAEDANALTYTVRTPYTGTVLRTFTVDSVTNPTIRS